MENLCEAKKVKKRHIIIGGGPLSDDITKIWAKRKYYDQGREGHTATRGAKADAKIGSEDYGPKSR